MCLDRTVPVYYNFTGNRGGWRRTSNTTFGLQSLKSKTSRIYFNEKYIPFGARNPTKRRHFEFGGHRRWYHLLLMTQQCSGVADQAPRPPLCKILTHQGIHYAGIRKIHPLCRLRYFIHCHLNNHQRPES